ncbi:hypothetical protein AGMMS49992_07480 [Clostridia bacterium]|nr:hypothetical protein AGMMS49992_07480 [Clostridia bacterium]
MSSYSLSMSEKETILNLNDADGMITYYSSTPINVRWIDRMHAANPQEVIIVERYEHGVKARMPRAWFRQPLPPRAKREMTDEQRAAFVERMRINRTHQHAISGEFIDVQPGESELR